MPFDMPSDEPTFKDTLGSESKAGSQIDKVYLGGLVPCIEVVQTLLVFKVKIQ